MRAKKKPIEFEIEQECNIAADEEEWQHISYMTEEKEGE